MAESKDAPNVEATRQMDALLARISAAYAGREKNPYALGVAVLELFRAQELQQALNYPSGPEVLRVRLPTLDQKMMSDAAAVVSWCSEIAAAKFLWDNLLLLNELINLGKVDKPVGGDPSDVRIPGLRTRFAQCTTDELRAAVQESKAKPPPRPHPTPPPIPATGNDETPVAPNARRLWLAAGLMATGAALSNTCIGKVVGTAGLGVLGAELFRLKLDGTAALAMNIYVAFRSGDWPKKKVGLAAVAMLAVGVAVRSWHPFAHVTSSLQSTADAMRKVASAVPERSVPPSSPAPATPAPTPTRTETAPAPAPIAKVQPPLPAPVPPPLATPPSVEPAPPAKVQAPPPAAAQAMPPPVEPARATTRHAKTKPATAKQPPKVAMRDEAKAALAEITPPPTPGIPPPPGASSKSAPSQSDNPVDPKKCKHWTAAERLVYLKQHHPELFKPGGKLKALTPAEDIELYRCRPELLEKPQAADPREISRHYEYADGGLAPPPPH